MGGGSLRGQANITPNAFLPSPLAPAPNPYPAGESLKHFLSNPILSSLQEVRTPRSPVSISLLTPLFWGEVT